MMLRPGAIASKARRSNDRALRNEAKMGDLSDGRNAAGSASSNEPSGQPLNLTRSYYNGGFREILACYALPSIIFRRVGTAYRALRRWATHSIPGKRIIPVDFLRKPGQSVAKGGA